MLKKTLESSSAKGYDFGDKKLIRRLFVDVEFELACTSRTPEQRVIIEGMFLNYQIFKNTILWITNLLRFRFYNKSMDS